MRKQCRPVFTDLVLSSTIDRITCRVVGPGKHQQSYFIYLKDDSLSHFALSTSLSCVKLRWFCWSPTFWYDSS